MAPPTPLGTVHGHVGIAHERVSVWRILRKHGNARTGAAVKLKALHPERLLQQLQEFGRNEHGLLHLVQLGQQHRELVAPQTPHRVASAQGIFQAPRHLHQHLVASGMAIAVVDGLEVVQIQQQQRKWPPLGRAGVDGLLQPLAKLPAVDQPGEVVMRCLVAGLGLQAAHFRDVAHKRHAGAAICLGVTQCHIDRHFGAIAPVQPQVALHAHGAARGVLEIAAHMLAMFGTQVRCQQDADGLAHELRSGITRDSLHGRVGHHDGALPVYQQDAVGCSGHGYLLQPSTGNIAQTVGLRGSGAERAAPGRVIAQCGNIKCMHVRLLPLGCDANTAPDRQPTDRASGGDAHTLRKHCDSPPWGNPSMARYRPPT